MHRPGQSGSVVWGWGGKAGGVGAAGRRPTTAGRKVVVVDVTDSVGSAHLVADVGSLAADVVEAVGSVVVGDEQDLGCPSGLLPW